MAYELSLEGRLIAGVNGGEKAFGVERTYVNGIPIVGDLNAGYGGSG